MKLENLWTNKNAKKYIKRVEEIKKIMIRTSKILLDKLRDLVQILK